MANRSRSVVWSSSPLVVVALLAMGCSSSDRTLAASDAGQDGGLNLGGGDAGSFFSDAASDASASDSSGGTDSAISPPTVDDTGKAALNGGQGITGNYGSFGVLTYSDTPRVSRNLAGNSIFISTFMGQGEWTLHIPDTPGTYDCGMGSTAGKVTISVAETAKGVVIGTGTPAFGGSCTLRLDSTMGHIEGAFAGVLSGKGGATMAVTSGYFFLAKGI